MITTQKTRYAGLGWEIDTFTGGDDGRTLPVIYTTKIVAEKDTVRPFIRLSLVEDRAEEVRSNISTALMFAQVVGDFQNRKKGSYEEFLWMFVTTTPLVIFEEVAATTDLMAEYLPVVELAKRIHDADLGESMHYADINFPEPGNLSFEIYFEFTGDSDDYSSLQIRELEKKLSEMLFPSQS